MRGRARRTAATIGVGLIALVAAGCGSSGHSSSGSSKSSGSSSGTSTTSAQMSGVGYTMPTKPSGTRIKGGTVTFAEAPMAPPNYIFPMTSFTYCSTSNSNQMFDMMVRPLYWFGNNYSPTVDYNYSIGQKPVFTDGDKTVTIHMNHWMWSNGTPVTARDVLFWLHMYQADPAANYCGAVPGFFPQNVTSASAPNAYTLVMHLNKSYDPEWFQYNELSQLTPLPLAWDRTSLSQPAPTNPNAKLPDDTKKGAEAVYTFLNAQSNKPATWATSPLWSIVDGPFKLSSYNVGTGEVQLVPNSKYSGSPKASIAKLVELPYTSDTAEFNQARSGGPSAVTITALPQQDVPQLSKLTSAGYIDNKASGYEFNYFPLNLHAPGIGPVFTQLYAREALAHLVDQPGWIKAYLDNTAVQTYGPVPAAPKSSLANAESSVSPYPFSTTAAATLLKDNGWTVKPGGTSTCAKPGSGSGECGAGVKSGQGFTFNVDYMSGVEAIQSEMDNLQAEAAKVGIKINLTEHPFSDVISKAVPCDGGPKCKWTAENWGAGWIYGPDYLPTGETLYGKGASSNAGSYYTPQAQALINKTVYGPLSSESASLTAFSNYIAKQTPVLYGPTSIGTFQSGGGTLISDKLGGYTANAMGFMTPEQWYLTK